MKKIGLTLFLLLCFMGVTRAGEQFIPKAYSYEAVGTAAQKVLFIYFYDLFEFPDGMANANLTTTEGLTIETHSGNTAIVSKPTYEHYLQNTRLRISRLGGVKGETSITVSIIYQGDTITNTFPVKILGLTTTPMTSYIEPETKESTFDVIATTNFYNDAEPSLCTVTIDNSDQLQYGVAELVEGEKGYKVIKYTQTGVPSKIVSEEIHYTITLSDGTERSSNTIRTYITKNCFASRIIEYQPAAGQFRCEEAWDKPNIISDKSSNTKGVSLGGLGGYIIYGFDQPIYNDPQNPYGVDFTIKGNSFIAAEKGVWSEPGAVQVMEDKNGDGIPNDGEWYELAGSDYWLSTTKHDVSITYYNPHYNERYTVPWTLTYKDKEGNTKLEHGALLSNQFHEHTFYPDYFYNNDNPTTANQWYHPNMNRDSITFSGFTEIRGCIDMRTPSYIEFYTVAGFGYCDNKGFNEADLRIAQNPYGRPSLGEDANDGMDISWAVDKNGNYVDLQKIDFVKIYTAGNKNAGWLGEWSTEVLNCAITLPDPTYVPQDYYYNYVGITQLQVPQGHTCQYEGFLFKNGRVVKDATQRWWLTDADGNSSADIDAIAEIDNTGLLKAKSIGSVWVHFSAKDGITEESFEVNVINLNKVVIGLEGYSSTVSNDVLQCIVGERIFINVESEDNNSTELNGTVSNRYIYDTYTWTNSNPEVGTMHQGSFKALKAGTTTLTVVSNTNPSLKDQIKINVMDVPEIQIKPIQIAANKPVGELLNYDCFSTPINATVYMDSVTAVKNNVNVSLYNNHLSYEFTEGQYTSDILKFKVTYFGQVKELEVPISYGPYNLASAKKLLIASNDNALHTLMGVHTDTYDTQNYLNNLGSTPVDHIITDGSYAYLSQGTELKRYDVAWGRLVASATLSSATTHSMAVYKDKLIITDANSIKVFYKTDLAPFTSLTLEGIAKQLTLDGDQLYVITNNEQATAIQIVDLTSWNISSHSMNMETVNQIAGLHAHNGKLYIPLVASQSQATAMMVYNTADNTTNTIQSNATHTLDAHNLSLKLNNKIWVACENGFIAFDLDNMTFANDILMGRENVLPINISGEWITSNDTTYARYYVAYNDAKLLIYDIPGSTSLKTLEVATPTAMTIMNATEENEAPTVKKAYSVTSGIYERATSAKSCTAAKLATYFADAQGTGVDNIQMYLRENLDWIDVTYAADGKMTPKVTYSGDLDEKTEFVFTLECIDKNGASVQTTATFLITPRIYKPTCKPVEKVIHTETTNTDITPVSDLFEYTQTKTNLTFTTVVSAISDSSLISNAEIDAEGNLVLTVASNKCGVAEVELAQTISHKSYGAKTFKHTMSAILLASADTTHFTEAACNSYTWTDGNTYTQSGDYYRYLQNQHGCDSIEVLHLTVYPEATTRTEHVELCPSELPYIWQGNTITAPGTYQHILPYLNMECDSIIYELIVNVYRQSQPETVTLPFVANGESIDVAAAQAELQSHIAADTLYAPNAEVTWWVKTNTDWEILDNTPVTDNTTSLTIKYIIQTDCGAIESSEMSFTLQGTGLYTPQHDQDAARKVLHNNQILILRNNKAYDLLGQEEKYPVKLR